MPAAQLSPQQIAQIGVQIHQNPQLQTLTQQILALQAQTAPRPGEGGPASYARTQPAREQLQALTQQYKEIANRYAPSGFEVTGMQNDGAPMLFNKENLTTLYITRAMIIGALGVGAIAAISGAASGGAAAGGFSTGAGATGAGSTASVLGGYGTVAPAVTGFSTGTAATGVAGTSASLSGYGTTAPAVGSVGATSAGGGGGAFDASGNFVGNSSYNIPSSTGSGLTGGDLTRYGLGTAGNIIGNYLQARAAGKASDAQQKYLEEALAYAKEKDAYDRQVAAEKVRLEASRYADYSGRIAPYLATGSDANARMASVMGLPSPAPYSAGPTMPSSTSAPRITTQPVPGGTMPSPGVPEGAGVPNPYDVPRGTGAAPQTPQMAGGMVHMQAPDGTQRLVPASQVQHYLSKGASVVS